jgi:Tfp pilus assembly protein PilN
MSTQRIDLYRDDLRPLEPSEELPRNLALIGLAMGAMLVWGGIAQWQASTSAKRLADLNGEQAELQSQMTVASEQLAARKPDPALTLALVEAQFGVDGRRWLVEQLSRAGDEVVPFSQVLEGLGRQRPAPLWLTRIRVAEAGAELGLGGRTLDADAVPGFLQRLSTEDALKNREFTHFAIERPEAPGEPLQFEMATDCVALAAGCNPPATAGGAR